MEEIQIDGGEPLGDDFYEEIEAPKFVDLTAPDRCRPSYDDRYWFCLRVGCDRKHEEEMDPEEIYKNFVLRVMAARSPNVRLRKALYGKDSSANVKCPLTAPAKSSKSRVSRLALISSMSKKMVDGKVKGRALPKQGGTPNRKEKQLSVVAKSLTTPRNKKHLSNHGTFRSVRNPKPTAIAVPKNRIVAKALVFHSPEKTVKTKTSRELSTRMRTICAGMKKLEITSGKKHTSSCNKPLPVDASRKQFRGREVKSRVYDSLRSQNCQPKEAKSSKCLKKKEKEQPCGPVFCEETENDSSDMEIEGKSRNCSLEVCSTSGTSKSNERNEHEESLIIQEVENKGEAISEASRSDTTPLLSSGESNTGENAGSGEGCKTDEESDNDKQIKFSPEKQIMPDANDTDEKENVSDDKENGGEILDGDNKENGSSSDDKRKLNQNSSHTEKKKTFGKHENSKSIQPATKGVSKTSKGNSTAAVKCAEGINYRKPKLTNPKPFRLRTDERQILKEANLEKKLHHTEPLKEITSFAKVPGGNLQRRHQNAVVQRNEKCSEQIECTCDAHEGGDRESERTTQKNQTQRMANSCSQTQKGALERKQSTTPQRCTVSMHQKTNLAASEQEFSQDKEAKTSGGRLKRTKSPYMKQLTRTEGISSRKKMVSLTSPGQLGVIKESSPTILRTEVVAKTTDIGAFQATKALASAASKKSPLGRKLTTPKEPHFHNVHVPKSCVRRVA